MELSHLHPSLPRCRPLVSRKLVARGDPRTGSEQARGGAREGTVLCIALHWAQWELVWRQHYFIDFFPETGEAFITTLLLQMGT